MKEKGAAKAPIASNRWGIISNTCSRSVVNAYLYIDSFRLQVGSIQTDKLILNLRKEHQQ